MSENGFNKTVESSLRRQIKELKAENERLSKENRKLKYELYDIEDTIADGDEEFYDKYTIAQALKEKSYKSEKEKNNGK